MAKNNDCIVAVSGVSGTGKTTLITHIEETFVGCRVVTYTTRPMRPSEAISDYHFCTPREIKSLSDTLWIKENYGYLYAVTRSSFLIPLKSCGIALLPTITSHHEALRQHFPDIRHVGIHLLSPGREELCARMQKRGDNKSHIERRLEQIEKIDRKALGNPLLYCLQPDSPDLILKSTLAYINSVRQ